MTEFARSIGSDHVVRYRVDRQHTVPALAIASSDIKGMPEVLATPYLVAMVECACIEHIASIDSERPMSLGMKMVVDHSAATPIGLTVTVTSRLEGVEGRVLSFSFTASDGVDQIGSGDHRRILVDRNRFLSRLDEKIERSGV